MKASKTENWFQTGFQQPKFSLQKNPVLTSLKQTPKNFIAYLACSLNC